MMATISSRSLYEYSFATDKFAIKSFLRQKLKLEAFFLAHANLNNWKSLAIAKKENI